MKIKIFILFMTLVAANANAALPKEVNPARIAEISSMLSENPQGIGVTYRDRAFWKKAGSDPKYKSLMKGIPSLISGGMPAFSDSLYLDLSKTGVRINGENMMTARFDYLFKLVMAECYENKNNYVPQIEQTIISLCEQNAWTLPAHDRDLATYRGTKYFVDLVAATFGNGLAQSVYILDDKLSPEVKQRVNQALEQKLFNPIRDCIKNETLFPWFTWTLNWNSVCLAGVVGAATATIQDREDRAFFLTVAEQYHTYGLDGYEDDGYCSEGVSYYNYGFRSLIVLRELVYRATQGNIDFFETPKLFNIMQYSQKIHIINKVCPLYSDCKLGSRPAWFINNYYQNALRQVEYKEVYAFPDFSNFSLNLIGFFPKQASPLKQNEIKSDYNPLRSYFGVAGVYVGRPDPNNGDCRIGVSAKGGHNAENHNHNDVGSYTVVLGQATMAGEAGGPISYPGDFWAADAYDKYKSKGSFGHPVPFVNNQTQREGRDAMGKVVRTQFTHAKDIFTIDMTSAYSDHSLELLERTFIYDRNDEGLFEVNDKFRFETAANFETAITTRAKWKMVAANTIELMIADEYIYVIIEASAQFKIISSVIQENALAYTRLGIQLLDKEKEGFVNIKYSMRK